MDVMDDYGTVLDRETVRIERLLPGSMERVWAFLTEPEKRRRWLADGAMALEAGGRVDLVFNNDGLSRAGDAPPAKYADMGADTPLTGTILDCDPPKRLRYSWGENYGEPSEVTFELAPRGERTLLVVTHRRLAGRDPMLSVASGWHAHLGILAAILAGSEPDSFWSTHTRLEAEYDRRIPKNPG